MPKYTVRVFLRSGAHFDLTGDEVVTEFAGSELTKLTWKGMVGNCPMFIDLRDVSAVVEMKEA